jgi:hypothetical protein
MELKSESLLASQHDSHILDTHTSKDALAIIQQMKSKALESTSILTDQKAAAPIAVNMALVSK